jgi:excinuclease ABC subunit C
LLDEVSGLGPARKKKLLAEFGSVAAMRELSLDELHTRSGLPRTVAEALYKALHA